MRNSIFSHGEHLENVGVEDILNLIKVDISDVFTHVLLRGIVDEDIDFSKPTFVSQRIYLRGRGKRLAPDSLFDMLLNSLPTRLTIHQISTKE